MNIKLVEKTVLKLINKSLEGKLSFEELYQLCPEVLAEDRFYEIIYNDIESVVEHFPGKFDIHFIESIDYKTLLIDQKLLNLIIEERPDSNDLLELRMKLLV